MDSKGNLSVAGRACNGLSQNPHYDRLPQAYPLSRYSTRLPAPAAVSVNLTKHR